ncbi:extracellular glycoprotein lacritin-like [Equus caballus]|uniref:extracellular glycoprotein lacritin-like n=1 Tax=Equus caballus TaxID=9796 RepID=UPI000C9DE601|nr:extracellular glycoprotein lacritin-like [Equus caballus]
MRFMALLFLAALAGALVCAQDASVTRAEPGAGITAPVESASPQETAAGDGFAPGEQLKPLKDLAERRLLKARRTLEEARKGAREGIEGGKKLFEGGTELLRKLRDKFIPIKP